MIADHLAERGVPAAEALRLAGRHPQLELLGLRRLPQRELAVAVARFAPFEDAAPQAPPEDRELWLLPPLTGCPAPPPPPVWLPAAPVTPALITARPLGRALVAGLDPRRHWGQRIRRWLGFGGAPPATPATPSLARAEPALIDADELDWLASLGLRPPHRGELAWLPPAPGEELGWALPHEPALAGLRLQLQGPERRPLLLDSERHGSPLVFLPPARATVRPVLPLEETPPAPPLDPVAIPAVDPVLQAQVRQAIRATFRTFPRAIEPDLPLEEILLARDPTLDGSLANELRARLAIELPSRMFRNMRGLPVRALAAWAAAIRGSERAPNPDEGN